MRNIEKELQKLDNVEIKKQNPILQKITEFENAFIEDFNKNFETIFNTNALNIAQIIAEKTPNIENIKTREIKISGTDETFIIPENIFQHFHKSYIEDVELRTFFEAQMKMWFSDKTSRIRASAGKMDTLDDLLKVREAAFALASLAISTFHQKPHMILRKAQKRTALVLSEGNIAELASGEGKTLAIVLTAYLQGLTEKGVHVKTANSYLAKRDFDELSPIYEGLGVSVGYCPNNEIEFAENERLDYNKGNPIDRAVIEKVYIKYKQEAYRKDITYGAIQSFAFDYLRDNTINDMDSMLQRPEAPGFSINDEVDETLIDSAKIPYILSMPTPTYVEDMSLDDLCNTLGISRSMLPDDIEDQFENPNELSYEEARYVSLTYAHCELYADPREYQELAQEFIEQARIYTVTGNEDKVITSPKEYFAALRDTVNYKILLREDFDIFYCKEENAYLISEEYYEKFLEKCYKRIQINTLALKFRDKIVADESYKEDEDYFFDGNKLKFTEKGAERIINDNNYPEFRDDYEKFITFINKMSVNIFHYLDQAATANLRMEKGKQYTVIDGEVKVLRDGRVQPKSKFSEGLQQAVEAKEKIEYEKRTIESKTTSSITQLDSILMYLSSSGTTGTASKKIFGRVYGKSTVQIPRACVEEKDVSELRGVDVRDTKFTIDVEDKINLIIRSVEKSQSLAKKQPVLIVVSNPNEFDLVVKALRDREGYKVNVLLPNVPKEVEAMMIAGAGVPGTITITTEMAGRGTDIILGGDRDTVLRTSSMINKRDVVEKVLGKCPPELEPLLDAMVSQRVEEELISLGFSTKDEEKDNRKELENIGLKVISCGIFDLQRTDEQLLGRTGRNGVSGVYERYVCLEDLKRLGISTIGGKESVAEHLAKLNKAPQGNLIVDDDELKLLMSEIEAKQASNENAIMNQIINAQELNSQSSKLVERLRKERRKLLCEKVDYQALIKEMIAGVTDSIISSYIQSGEINEDTLTKPISDNGITMDFEAVCLELKQILGVTFDFNAVEKSEMSLSYFRDRIIKTADVRRIHMFADLARRVVLEQNEYMISGVKELLERCFTVRNLTLMGGASKEQNQAITNIEFRATERKLTFESYKSVLTPVIGLPLTFEEYKRLEEKKNEIFGVRYKRVSQDSPSNLIYEASESKNEENNLSVIDRLRVIKERVDQEAQEEKEEIQRQIENSRLKQHKEAVRDIDRKNVKVRAMTFIDKLVDKNRFCSFNLLRDKLSLQLSLIKAQDGVKKVLSFFSDKKKAS